MNLGYDRENLIYIPLEGDLTSKYSLFKNQAAEYGRHPECYPYDAKPYTDRKWNRWR